MKTQAEWPRVLIVEDEQKLALTIHSQLGAVGYDAGVALDGVEGLGKALGEHWDIIILDLNLPKKSGLQMLRSLRTGNNRTPVLILSARGGRRTGSKGSVQERMTTLQSRSTPENSWPGLTQFCGALAMPTTPSSRQAISRSTWLGEQ